MLLTVSPPLDVLEVYITDKWGTVCSNGFNMASANVACQKLGFSQADRWSSVGEQRYSKTSVYQQVAAAEVT